MKSLATVLILCAGLVSVHAQNGTATATDGEAEATASSTSTESSATATATGFPFGFGSNILDPNFDPASLNLDNVFNLGNINFDNDFEVANVIAQLMNGLCLGQFFNLNNVLSLGNNQELQLLLELQQLQQLQALGFVNVFDLQSLFKAGLFNNGFNFGFFKRAVDERKKTLKRNKLRRGGSINKQQCGIANVATTTTASDNEATTTADSSETTGTGTGTAASAEATGTSEPGRLGAEGR